MDKNKRTLVLGDDGEIPGEVLSIPEKPKRFVGSGFRRPGCAVIAILLTLMLGVVMGVIGYSRYQTASTPAPDSQLAVGIQATPMLSPESILTKTAIAPPATAIPRSTNIGQTSTPRGASHILWVSNCDPRTDSRQCSQGKIETFNEFYTTIQTLGADIIYTVPRSSAELYAYDVVVLSFCDLAASTLSTQLFQDYVSGGGSLIVMGDNFCQGVPADGKLGSSAEAASLLTMSWGIRFTADDDANNPEFTTFIGHPLTAGIKAIYSFRHAYLTVQAPATAVASINHQAVIALYDGTGTVVAVPDTGFAWGSGFKSQIGNADNFTFWRNSFVWLSQQTRAKRG